MPTITRRIIKGHAYYYAVQSKRLNGKPRLIMQKYLGSADDLIAAVDRHRTPVEPHKIRPRRQNSVGFCKLISHRSWRIGYPLSAAAVMSCSNAGMRTICRSFVLSDAVSGLAPVCLATAGL